MPDGKRVDRRQGAESYRTCQFLVCLLLGIVLVFTFVGRVIAVNGSSMLPTLHHGDILLLQTLGYAPRQGDVVVLSKASFREGAPIVKRVIAVGGQTVTIDYTVPAVYVDGVALDEPYLLEAMQALPDHFLTHVQVPEGSIFVMGDNRNSSADSRDPELGVVDVRRVLGRAFFVMFPFRNAGIVETVSSPAPSSRETEGVEQLNLDIRQRIRGVGYFP